MIMRTCVLIGKPIPYKQVICNMTYCVAWMGERWGIKYGSTYDHDYQHVYNITYNIVEVCRAIYFVYHTIPH